MKTGSRIFLLALILGLLLLTVGPLLLPLPPLKNVIAPEQLAEADSTFLIINDISVHYRVAGKVDDTLILLHGFGASTFTWHKVMKPMADDYRVIAYDRTGSGLTSRPLPGEWSGESPYSKESQAEQVVALMDRLGIEKAVFIGSSAGGAIAALTALTYPERIRALILVDAAIFQEGPPGWLKFLMRTPQLKRLGPFLVRKFGERALEKIISYCWHDPSKLTPAVVAGYKRFLQIRNWDRALWELARADRPLHLFERLREIRVPVLVITGDDDRLVPQEQSQRIALEIPQAELVVVSNCGHLPHEETPEKFLHAVKEFLQKIL